MLLNVIYKPENLAKMPVRKFEIGGFKESRSGIKIISWPFFRRFLSSGSFSQNPNSHQLIIRYLVAMRGSTRFVISVRQTEAAGQH